MLNERESSEFLMAQGWWLRIVDRLQLLDHATLMRQRSATLARTPAHVT
jgi:hypothetical protein